MGPSLSEWAMGQLEQEFYCLGKTSQYFSSVPPRPAGTSGTLMLTECFRLTCTAQPHLPYFVRVHFDRKPTSSHRPQWCPHIPHPRRSSKLQGCLSHGETNVPRMPLFACGWARCQLTTDHWRTTRLLIPLNACRRKNYYLPWECENERHGYEKWVEFFIHFVTGH